MLKEGDEVMVKVICIDKTGKIRLSRKEALAERAGTAVPPTAGASASEAPKAKA